MVRQAALAGAMLLLGACGYKGTVSRIDMNRTDVPKAELQRQLAAERERVEAAQTPAPQERPERVDDVLSHPDERAEDLFSLPPE